MRNVPIWINSAFLIAAAASASGQTMSGNGAKQCADFMQAVQLNSESAINGYISWAQGFISGFNWSNVQGRDVVIDH